MDTFQQLTMAFLSFTFLIIFIHRRNSSPGKRLPPSPRKLPVIGNLHQVGGLPHRSLYNLSRRHGPLMLLHFGNVPVVVASSSAAACAIMKDQDTIFSDRPWLRIADRLTYGSRDVAFAPYGEYWRQAKSICVVHLLNTKRVQSFRRVREEETSAMVEKIKIESGKSLPSVVNLSDALVSLTNDVVCRVAFGRKYRVEDGEGRRFKEFLGEFIELLGTLNVGDYIPWLRWIGRIDGTDSKVERVARLFDEFLVYVIEEHRRSREKGEAGGLDEENDLDFVDILLKYQTEIEESTTLVKDESIKAIIVDMFAGGTDTTASLLEWAMAELIKNPEAMKKLQNEVRKAAEKSQEITEDVVDKMPYLKAVIKETLRLHSPIPLLVARQSTKDTKLMGYDIAAGTRVVINASAIGRDPSLWESPEEFKPDRFLDSTIDFKGFHFELVPFGAGRRGCPGVAFAVTINELALAKLVNEFDFSLPEKREVTDLDMCEALGITVRRKNPLVVVVTNSLP
ncbi:cytochrome P450 71A6-like [Andrographis paniculata]|uniref:cytochrome P450 71A6-like n=1 Tax=Andrographis paniculata TaxID=175694 RepID=UPI0021E914D9|nr:cytochrome P450 71A6-like [Andrographis paniculata]